MTDLKIKKSDVREMLEGTLGIKKKEQLDEAYVAQPKSYDHPTELISEKTKKLHQMLYESYISDLNTVSARLDAVDRQQASANQSAYRSLKLDETNNLNAVWLHELYFANMSDVHSEIMADSLAYLRLERDWGTFSDWQIDFIASAMSARNGWVVCGYHMFLQRYVNFFVDGHDGHIPMGVYPTIVIDVWEHARRDYLDDKAAYVRGQMMELSWHRIEERFKKAEQVADIVSGGIHQHGT